jgi:general secretion pathway protein L
MSALLRVALPELRQLSPDSELDCAWLDAQGRVLEQGRRSLSALAKAGAKAVELCLHPSDSLFTHIALPPLPAARMAAAVGLAVDSLLLVSLAQTHVVHGPRNSAGQVPIAWLARSSLERLLQLLAQCAISPRGLYPAGAFLALAAPAQCSLCVQDGYLLVREDGHRLGLHPLPAEGLAQWTGRPVQWLGEVPECAQGVLTDVAPARPSAERWTGPLPPCNLLLGFRRGAAKPQAWGRAVACTLLAVLIWTVGLNLYARQMAMQGQQLKSQMVSQVKQAFPALPVILNPLQQARQQLAAGLAQPGEAPTFASLVEQTSSGLPFLAGAVQVVEYDGRALHVQLRHPVRKPAAPQQWQEALAGQGLQATEQDGRWTIQRIPLADSQAPLAGTPATQVQDD